jgi:DNA-binding HxlR family transcriptional regulator
MELSRQGLIAMPHNIPGFLVKRNEGHTRGKLMTREEILSYSQAVCDGLREDEDGVRREVLTHAGNRWSLGVIHTLGVYGRLRHADIGRRMHGVTQRMLTRTLRQLERDGLVTRYDLVEMPPRVEYELTELGMGLLIRMIPLWTWVVENSEEFRKSREGFDSRLREKPSWQTPWKS